MVAAVNADQQVVLKPRRVDLVRFEPWATKQLRPTDQVVLESTTNAWTLHDWLQPIVARVVVAHPYHIKLIASAAVKTDKRDTLALARLLSAHMIPEVWVPPQHVRDLRALIAHRQRLVSQRTAAKNRLQSVLHRHQLVPPRGALFAKKNSNWWRSLSLPASERLRITQDQAIIAYLNPMIDEVEAEIKKLSVSDLWANQVLFLLQLPGIGLVKAMTILGAIGEIERFLSAKKLVGYAGLGSRVHSSGQTHHTGATLAPHAVQVSPNKAGGNCAMLWSKRPGLRFKSMLTGRKNSIGSNCGLAKRRPLWPSPGNCSSPSGTF
jgi:transposase